MNLDKKFCHMTKIFECDNGDKAWDYLIPYAGNKGWLENSGLLTPDEFLFIYSQIGIEGDPVLKDMTITETNLSKKANATYKKNCKSMVQKAIDEGDVISDKIQWLYDKTKPAPLEAVMYWKDYTESNDWYLTVGGFDEVVGKKEELENKTVEEVKAKIAEFIEEWLGDPLVSQDVQPVDFDEYGGVIMNKSMKDADDEDTFMVTNYNGDSFAVDGIDKAKETAIRFRKERAEFELSYYVYRKITEPGGYFAWRQENISDYL